MDFGKGLLKKLILLLFWPAGFVLAYGTSFYPEFVDKYYSQLIYRTVMGPVSRFFGIFTFSVAEIIVLLLISFMVLGLIITCVKKLKAAIQSKKNSKRIIDDFYKALIIAGISYFAFIALWGINYNRLSFSEIASMEIKPAHTEELEQLCVSLIARANTLRLQVREDSQGVMKIEGGYEEVLKTARAGYEKTSGIYSELSGRYGDPKPVFLSAGMSYMGISGVYFPFTGEANVNVDIPECMLPCTAAHEMAHQRGFAREDEANYIAWLVCKNSDDVNFQYSGTLLALIHSMNALYIDNPEIALELKKNYSEGLLRDLIDLSDYWKKHQGKAEKITSDVNDAYLKSNRQEDGVKSYGRMVDLLLAEQRV
ncbi:MAG: DUF3810 domain-containing protein [Eubacteriales bacterium]